MMSQGIITDTPDSASDTFDAQLQPGDVIVLYVRTSLARPRQPPALASSLHGEVHADARPMACQITSLPRTSPCF